jgi:protein arginine N-methyltransferase 3
MLDSVLFARDKWLAPGGCLLPDQAGMWWAALDEQSGYASRVGYWDDVYGFRMSCMRRPILKEAAVTIVPPESIMSNIASLRNVAIGSVTPADLQFDAPFQLVIKRETKLTVRLPRCWAAG